MDLPDTLTPEQAAKLGAVPIEAPPPEKPSFLSRQADRFGAGLSRIGNTIASGAGAAADAISAPLEALKDPHKRRELERGIDNMVTLGYGQKAADWVSRKFDPPERQIGATAASDQQDAPGYRELGTGIGMVLPGAAKLGGKIGGKLAGLGSDAAGTAAMSLPARLATGGARGVLGYEATAPVLSGLSADASGNRLSSAADAATDPAGLLMSGAGGVAGAAAEKATETAPARVAERRASNISSGETNAKLKTARKVVAKAGEGGDDLDELISRDPHLGKLIDVKAKTAPAKVAAAVASKLDDIADQQAPYYEAIDNATSDVRQAASRKQLGDLQAQATAARQEATELRAKANPERSLFGAARDIDAPVGGEPSLLDLARRIDAPISDKAAREGGREQFTEQSNARHAAQAKAAAEADAAEAHATKLEQMAARDERRLNSKDSPAGIDISAIDHRLYSAASDLAKQGKAVVARAVSRTRANLAQLYGTDGKIPEGTILPARSVRNLATELGKTAFEGDPTVEASSKTLAQQKVFGAVAGEIEKAAEAAGLDVNKLRQLNSDMSILIPVHRALEERASSAQAGRMSLPEMFGHAAGMAAGAGVGTHEFGPTGALLGLAAPAAVKLGAQGARLADWKLAHKFGGVAPEMAAKTGARAGELEFAAKVSEGMKAGLSLEEALAKAKE